ncbi:hypothetical protein FMK90_03955 [Klebsiella grimontii]|nr:hypothetical protein BWI76_06430 [Klebsiella sp. M5al]AWT19585.1 hypothetical protein DMP75_14880 [Klebsiella michiganensis]KAA0494110.1 hypothetical protein F0332_05515 [Klebsiella grimontii]MBW6009332.1 hypothetical protein [Klebsiella sp. CVUAS 11263]MBW6029681.1 hypothetical protein [Klebsiella sp. CVUAS 11332]MBX4739127.1 hypothetical protein [Klebsiella sp. CVUAS 10975.2]MBX4754400.1 hypothetical protein [Klebsiella sp. CVUAS 8534.2]MBX4775518.1 hypothetical protein [Klebsiella sp. 
MVNSFVWEDKSGPLRQFHRHDLILNISQNIRKCLFRFNGCLEFNFCICEVDRKIVKIEP